MMKKLKASIEIVIGFPVEALRSAVVDVGLMRAQRQQCNEAANCKIQVLQN